MPEYKFVLEGLLILLKVVEFKTPEELHEQINFRVGKEGVDSKEILSLCDQVLSLCVHTCKH